MTTAIALETRGKGKSQGFALALGIILIVLSMTVSAASLSLGRAHGQSINASLWLSGGKKSCSPLIRYDVIASRPGFDVSHSYLPYLCVREFHLKAIWPGSQSVIGVEQYCIALDKNFEVLTVLEIRPCCSIK